MLTYSEISAGVLANHTRMCVYSALVQLTSPSGTNFLFLLWSVSSVIDGVAPAVAHSCGNACGSPLPSYIDGLVDSLSVTPNSSSPVFSFV